MDTADTAEPFFVRRRTDPVLDPETRLVSQAGVDTVFSALDEVVIADAPSAIPSATVVAPSDDLVVYGLDVVLASDLRHAGGETAAGRNVSLFCRRLTILAPPGSDLTIDVAGATGGSIRIACETLVLRAPLRLKASPAKGGGVVQLVCCQAVNGAGAPVDLLTWVEADSRAELIETIALPYPDVGGRGSVPDVSVVAAGTPLDYWALLHHRVDRASLAGQAGKRRRPATDDEWRSLGTLLEWTSRLVFAYGDTSASVKGAGLAHVAADRELAGKNDLARALKRLMAWYQAGRTAPEHAVTAPPPPPPGTA